MALFFRQIAFDLLIDRFVLSSSSFLNSVLSLIVFTLTQYLDLFFYFIDLAA